MSKPIFCHIDYDENYVMHCDSPEKAKIFGEYLDKNGLKWLSGQTYSENGMCWSNYQELECYRFWAGTHGSSTWYQDSGYFVLEFDDYDWSAFGWASTDSIDVQFSFDEFMGLED